MLENSTIARPYARAAFELAQQDGNAKAWATGLGVLQAIVSDSRIQSLLGDPRVTQEVVSAIIDEIGGRRISKAVRNFARVLADAGRLRYVPQIARQFEAMQAEAEGIVDVRLVSAAKLSKLQQDQLAHGIKRRLGKEVRLSATVDESLIGGVIIRAGDSVIDASVRGRLRELGNTLA